MHSYGVIAFRSALVAGLALFSGTASAMSFGVGPIGGATLSNANVEIEDEEIDTEMLTRMAIGARAEFGVTSPFSLLLEPTYLQRGATQTGEAFGVTVEVDTRLNYLELPVLAKAKFGAMKAHAYVFAGPSFGIFLNGESESGGETQDAEDISALNITGEAGVGGSFQVQEFIYLNADVRYGYGFSNANDSDIEGDWNNRDIRIMACVLFHLTK